MEFFSTLALKLGPIIAKSVLQRWLRDVQILSDLAPELVDILNDSSDKMRSRSVEYNRFEIVANRTAERMRVVFQNELLKQEEAERESILTATSLAVATALARTKITADLLVECNLDADKLLVHIANAYPEAVNTLSEIEEQIYKRIMSLASREIVESAAELSGFMRSSFAATLAGQDESLEKLNEILAKPSAEAALFEKIYRENVERRLDRMEIFGVPSMDMLTRRQKLSVAYVNLRVDRDNRMIWDRSPLGDDLALRIESSIDEQDLFSGSIEHLLSLKRRLVMRGEAGSGKSTLLQWLAVRSAKGDFPPRLNNWNDTIPFFIRLRECVEAGFPSPEEFPRMVARTVAGTMPTSWVHRQLEIGRALVLVDGVDEIPVSKRQDMLIELAQLVEQYPNARYIITSRPSALRADLWPEWEEWVLRKSFSEAVLLPMGIAQINQFIDQWHRALGDTIQDDEELIDLEALPGSLKRLLMQRLPLRRLATNPLLCAMLCALHRERQQQLPSERLKLYEECCEMLLSRRDEGRKIVRDSNYPDISLFKMLALVQDLAYWMMRNGYSDAEITEIDAQFNKKLPELGLPEAITSQGIRRFLIDRSSLLREPVVGRVDFAHRTFQEFLAAQQAVKEGDIGFLIERALDDQWREMIILAAGLARPAESKRLLEKLIEKGGSSQSMLDRQRLYLLAVACLETCVELTANSRTKIMNEAARFIPSSSIDEERLVVGAGDPVVPLLAAKEFRSVLEATSCVRCLVAIGTEAALKELSRYAALYRKELQEELGRGWEVFDRRDYAKRVLANCSHLYVSTFSSWVGLEHLGGLVSVEVGAGLPFEELGPLSILPNLRVVSLWNCKEVVNLEPLAQLPQAANLTEVSLGGGFEKVESLEPLSCLKRAISLTLASFENVRDLYPLASLKTLRSLSLDSCSRISSLDALADLTSLRTLSLDSCSQIRDLSPLSNLRNLAELNLRGTWVRDLSPLAVLSNLVELEIGGWEIPDTGPLSHLKNLKIKIEWPSDWQESGEIRRSFGSTDGD